MRHSGAACFRPPICSEVKEHISSFSTPPCPVSLQLSALLKADPRQERGGSAAITGQQLTWMKGGRRHTVTGRGGP